LYFYYAYLALKAKNVFFITAVNPSIQNGGCIRESKKLIMNQIPLKNQPITIHLEKQLNENQILHIFKTSNLHFPIIAKRDIGERGVGIEILKTENELLAYKSKYQFDFMVQEYLPWTFEAGVMVVKTPQRKSKLVTSICYKDFLNIT